MTPIELRQKHLDALAERYGGLKYPHLNPWLSFRRMECRLHRLLASENEKNYERIKAEIKKSEEIYRQQIASRFVNSEKVKAELWFNHDWRGYCIKLNIPRSEQTDYMSIDFGGNVILAPGI